MNAIYAQYKYKGFIEPLRRLRYELLEKLLEDRIPGANPPWLHALKPNCSVADNCETEMRKAKFVDYYIDLLSVSKGPLADIPDVTQCDMSYINTYTIFTLEDPA